MANVEWHCGFDGCGSTEDLLAFADGDSSCYLDETHGYNGGKCIGCQYSTSYSRFFQKNCTPGKTKSVGCHINPTGYSNGGPKITLVGPDITLYIPGSDTGMRVNDYGNSGGIAPPLNTITHIEFKVFSDVSAGTVQVWLNGALVINLSGLNTGGQDITSVKYAKAWQTVYFDDIFCADDWVGHSTVVKKDPISDVSTAFTPSTGTDNYAMVDDDGQDGDDTYVETIVTGQDLYAFETVDASAEIVAASSVIIAKKTGAGKYPAYIQHLMKQGTTEYLGDQKILSVEYPHAQGAGLTEQYPTAPDGSAWTPTIWNAINAGFKGTLTSP